MAISLNLTTAASALGGRFALNPVLAGIASQPAAAPAPQPAPNIAAAPSAPVTAFSPAAASSFLFNPAAIGVSPVVQPSFFPPPILQPPILQPPPQSKTSTQLAGSAINQLNNAVATSVTQALNAIKNKSFDGPGIIPYLERKVRIGEVLNDLAKDWSAPTRIDFGDAFSVDPNNPANNDVMDSIVSMAILNDKDLMDEILAENTPHTTPADLTDNRRIVWQSVPPGTVLSPPYVILVAVEYRDIAQAQDVVQSITDQLGMTTSNFRLPKLVIQKGVN